MALVKCPECGKEVSSQLRKCNNCGYKLKRIDKKKRNVFIVIFCVIIMLTIVGFILLHNNQDNINREYRELLVEAGEKIYTNGLIAESYCYDISKVWYNTIFKKSDSEYDIYTKSGYYIKNFNSDFSKSVYNYLTMNSDDINELKTEQQEIEKVVLKLQEKPNEEYKDAYNKLIEMYGSFNNLVEQVISPSGNYSSYSSKYNEYVEDLKSQYDQLVVLIPEIKNNNQSNVK